jgi:hypothetical protein
VVAEPCDEEAMRTLPNNCVPVIMLKPNVDQPAATAERIRRSIESAKPGGVPGGNDAPPSTSQRAERTPQRPAPSNGHVYTTRAGPPSVRLRDLAPSSAVGG